MIEAKVIKDSISPDGIRLTTMELSFHRFILAEFNTHRKLSRNSASSRAIPIMKQIKKILKTPAYPVEFGTHKAGMQADVPLEGGKELLAKSLWKGASITAVGFTYLLHKLGVHKQVANRILEPFMWHKVIVTSTEWENFFGLRISELAQPEINALAILMKDALDASTPEEIAWGEWHLPYVSEIERSELPLFKLVRISAARCARVSYLTHDGLRDLIADLNLYKRLTSASPAHASPLEHVATPTVTLARPIPGNFDGFLQLRHVVLGENPVGYNEDGTFVILQDEVRNESE